MIVTEIKQQKKDKSRYSVYIDGEFAFGLIMDDILYFKLKEGEEIPEEKYRYIMDTTVYIKAQDAAVSYLGYKMRYPIRHQRPHFLFFQPCVQNLIQNHCRFAVLLSGRLICYKNMPTVQDTYMVLIFLVCI